MRCPNIECGAEVAEGSAFCERCGTPMPVATGKLDDAPAAFCEHCGTRLSTGAAFCKRCGKPTGTTTGGDTVTPAAEQPQATSQTAGMPAESPSAGEVAATPDAPSPTAAGRTDSSAAGKRQGGRGLKVAVIILAVAVVAMGIALGGMFTNWYGLGGGGRPTGEARAVAVTEISTNDERGEHAYDDLGNSILYESTTLSDGSPFTTTTTTYDADGNPMHEVMRFAEGYEDIFHDTDNTYEYDLDDQGRAAVAYTRPSGSDQVTIKTYLSYHPDGTFREIKSCYVQKTTSSGSPDTYRYMEGTQEIDERGLPISYVLRAWPSSTEPLDFMEYEASVHAGLAPEGGILEEQSYEWSYDGWKPTSVTVRKSENQLEDDDREDYETSTTYEVDADGYGDVTEIRGSDGEPLLRLEYITVRPSAIGTVARARDTMSHAIWFCLRNT